MSDYARKHVSLLMMSDYASRHVTLFGEEIGERSISTLNHPVVGWETAILDSDGECYSVERYSSREAAYQGHERWKIRVKSISTEELKELALV